MGAQPTLPVWIGGLELGLKGNELGQAARGRVQLFSQPLYCLRPVCRVKNLRRLFSRPLRTIRFTAKVKVTHVILNHLTGRHVLTHEVHVTKRAEPHAISGN